MFDSCTRYTGVEITAVELHQLHPINRAAFVAEVFDELVGETIHDAGVLLGE